ncbi:MAG TPA: xanthine dehydrogenase family protein subunit M [Hyphomicrobiaceae bacterium]|nr:xanthine dehydrogenase family protein subunit M [Hyphomicrobiaceae bacterium]
MNELKYERPTSVDDAIACMGMAGARALAGGSDLIPQLREGRRVAGVVVDLKHVPALVEIASTPDGGWRIGAAASVTKMRRHEAFFSAHRALVDSACLIGSLQVQARASLGGNLCNAAPSADGVPLLIALGAEAEIHGPGGIRRAPAEAVPTGPGRTSLSPGELLVALHLPPRVKRSADRYLRFTPRREMDIAVAGAGVRIDLDDRGAISVARVVLASVGPVPVRAKSAEALLVGQLPTARLLEYAGASAAQECTPISDTRGTAAYRRDLVAVLTRRALADCAGRLGVFLS